MAYELVWTKSQADSFERLIHLKVGRKHDPQCAAFVLRKFVEDTTLYPMEWPASAEPPSLNEWNWGAIHVRYRRLPSQQQIEVLEVFATPEE